MTRAQWQELFRSHPHWEVVDERGGYPVVWNRKTGRFYRVDRDADVTPEEAEEVLEGIREPVMLHTITRITGYYSSTENWQRSKLGELADRRKGNYALSPSEKPKRKNGQEVAI